RRVDRVVCLEFATETFRAHLRQRRRQRRLAVVNVTDRAHVHVGLGALELTLGHGSSRWVAVVAFRALSGAGLRVALELVLTTGIEPATSSLPRRCSTD